MSLFTLIGKISVILNEILPIANFQHKLSNTAAFKCMIQPHLHQQFEYPANAFFLHKKNKK
jgi:hypothetical protein